MVLKKKVIKVHKTIKAKIKNYFNFIKNFKQ